MAQNNIRTVVSFEVVRTLRTKVFWIGALLGPVLLALLIGVSVASSSSASNTDQPEQSFTFEWFDHSGLVLGSIASSAGGVLITDPAQGLADVQSGRVEAFFEYPLDPTSAPIIVSAQDQGILLSDKYSSLAAGLLRASVGARVDDPALVQLLSGAITTEMTTYQDGEPTPGIWGMIAPLALIALFFIIVVMQGNRMLTATLEEKENRVTEMILTTIKPTALLTGKVISLGIIGVIQALVIAIPTVVVAIVLAETGKVASFDLSKLIIEPMPMVIGVLLLIGGFLLFTCSLVAIGAAMPTAKDAQGMFATVILLLVIPIYLVVWMLTNPDNLIVAILTYFPWTAPITAMARNGFGTLPWWQGLIVAAILFASAYLVFRVAARLFQYGSVEYSKKISVRSALGKP